MFSRAAFECAKDPRPGPPRSPSCPAVSPGCRPTIELPLWPPLLAQVLCGSEEQLREAQHEAAVMRRLRHPCLLALEAASTQAQRAPEGGSRHVVLLLFPGEPPAPPAAPPPLLCCTPTPIRCIVRASRLGVGASNPCRALLCQRRSASACRPAHACLPTPFNTPHSRRQRRPSMPFPPRSTSPGQCTTAAISLTLCSSCGRRGQPTSRASRRRQCGQRG